MDRISTEDEAQGSLQDCSMFRHTSLKDPGTEIRLLSIERETCGQICVSITTWPLARAPVYAALSYTWGTSRGIYIRVNHNQLLEVTKNAYTALAQLRGKTSEAHYWIDAICVDQANVRERSIQVSIMGEIYRRASCVFASLGESERSCARHFTRLENLTPGLIHEITRHPCRPEQAVDQKVAPQIAWWNRSSSERQVLLTEMAQCAYWERVWIVQEIALAREVVILYGDGLLSWNHVRDCYNPLWAGCQAMDSTAMARGSYSSGYMTLAETLEHFVGRKTKEPMDRLFGTLALVHWPEDQGKLEPDYSLSRFELAIKALPHLMQLGESGHSDLNGLARKIRVLIKALEIDRDEVELLQRAAAAESTGNAAPQLVTRHIRTIFELDSDDEGNTNDGRFVYIHSAWARSQGIFSPTFRPLLTLLGDKHAMEHVKLEARDIELDRKVRESWPRPLSLATMLRHLEWRRRSRQPDISSGPEPEEPRATMIKYRLLVPEKWIGQKWLQDDSEPMYFTEDDLLIAVWLDMFGIEF